MARFATYTRNTGINPKDKITYSGLIEASELEDALRYETVTSTIEDLGLFFAGKYFSTDGINYNLASIEGRVTALENQVESDPVFALWNRSTGIEITTSQITDYSAPTLSSVTTAGNSTTTSITAAGITSNGNLQATASSPLLILESSDTSVTQDQVLGVIRFSSKDTNIIDSSDVINITAVSMQEFTGPLNKSTKLNITAPVVEISGTLSATQEINMVWDGSNNRNIYQYGTDSFSNTIWGKIWPVGVSRKMTFDTYYTQGGGYEFRYNGTNIMTLSPEGWLRPQYLTVENKTTTGTLVISDYANLNFADDAAAAAGGVELGGIYHTSGVLKIRIQ